MNRTLARLKIWWLRRRHPELETFGPDAKAVLASANAAAIELQADHMDTGHILLGILRTTSLLERLSADTQGMRRDIFAMGNARDSGTENAKNVVAASIEEARAIGVRILDPELLLVGLLQLEGTIAEAVLTRHKVTLGRARGLRRTSDSGT